MVERRRARFEAGALALDLLGVMAERQALVDSIRNLENLKRESDRLFRLGHLRETDVLKVALALDDARQGLLQLNASEQNIRAALSRWVPGPQPMSLEPPGPFVGFAVQEPLERPELKALGWEEQARWEAAAFEKTSGGPLLEAQGRWLHTGQDTLAERRWAEGRLILSWRLWDGARSARSVAAEKEAQSAALLRDDLRLALAAEKTAAENQVRVVTEEVHRSLPNRDRARQNLEGERRRYQNGRVSMGDLLEAEALSLRWEREARLAPLRLARAYLQFELASGRNPSLPFANKLK
jgi:outer membrane protein TolC